MPACLLLAVAALAALGFATGSAPFMSSPLAGLSGAFSSMPTLATQDYFAAGPVCAIGSGGSQILCWFTAGIASPGDKRFVVNAPRGLRRVARFTGVRSSDPQLSWAGHSATKAGTCSKQIESSIACYVSRGRAP